MSKRLVVGVVVLAAVVGAYVIGGQGGSYQVLTVTFGNRYHIQGGDSLYATMKIDKKTGHTWRLVRHTDEPWAWSPVAEPVLAGGWPTRPPSQ